MDIVLKKRVHFLLFVIGVISLSITAEKFRLLVGEEAASKSGQFTILNCFDGSSGTLACVVKEGVKLYTYNIRSLHVESRRNQAIETALADAVTQGMTATEAAKVAQKEGAKAAKVATRKAKRILGPIVSSGWDFFEAIYFGGTITEGFLRGTGTLFGTYYVGFVAEERLGRFGYLVGSQLGSWIGGRIGLMAYDVANGVYYMMQPTADVLMDQESRPDYLEKSEVVEDSYVGESTYGSSSPDYFEKSEVVEDSYVGESTYGSGSDSEDEISADQSFDAHEEL